ncbi:MAG: hypothetical protein QOH91_3766, partial [Mycobacterium sp.]|nr:hypothetical protein [Mycobacterium sp.]
MTTVQLPGHQHPHVPAWSQRPHRHPWEIGLLVLVIAC